MKLRFFILFLLLNFNYSYGNMASPWDEGTLGASPFISQFVEIVHEKIKIKISDDFREASYEIKYTLNVQKNGIQIPLLFLALEYERNFEILLDGAPLELKKFPYEYDYKSDSSKIKDFNYCLNEDGRVLIKWNKNFGEVQHLNDLKYFEVDLSKGIHTFEVKYVAQPFTLYDSWIVDYSFRYSLSPAKYWKNFGYLEIEVVFRELKKKITFNLPPNSHDKENGVMKWKFDTIPSETFIINYSPEINKNAKKLIDYGPDNIFLSVFFFLVLLHFFLAKSYRKNSTAKYSWVIIVGSIINPFLAYLAYSYSFDYIDYLIGEHATRRHGYTFLLIFFYPIILVIYLTIAWQIDKYWVRKKEKTV